MSCTSQWLHPKGKVSFTSWKNPQPKLLSIKKCHSVRAHLTKSVYFKMLTPLKSAHTLVLTSRKVLFSNCSCSDSTPLKVLRFQKCTLLRLLSPKRYFPYAVHRPQYSVTQHVLCTSRPLKRVPSQKCSLLTLIKVVSWMCLLHSAHYSPPEKCFQKCSPQSAHHSKSALRKGRKVVTPQKCSPRSAHP